MKNSSYKVYFHFIIIQAYRNFVTIKTASLFHGEKVGDKMLKYHENIYSWEDEHIIEKKIVIFKKKKKKKKRLYFNHDQFLLHVKFKH